MRDALACTVAPPLFIAREWTYAGGAAILLVRAIGCSSLRVRPSIWRQPATVLAVEWLAALAAEQQQADAEASSYR